MEVTVLCLLVTIIIINMRSYAIGLVCLLAMASMGTTQQALPGSMEVTLSVTSINNIVELIAAILPQYVANNKTLPINFNTSGFGYSIIINDIHFNTLVINNRSIGFIPGTKTVRARFSGINLDSTLEGTLTMVSFINLDAA